MSIEALKKIANIENKYFGGDWDEIEEAREIARQAIAEAEKQEPVAWDLAEKVRRDLDRQSCPGIYMNLAMESIVKHYTHPQPKREWVGLNWDDLPEIYVGDAAFLHGAKWAEAKLKEKNT